MEDLGQTEPNLCGKRLISTEGAGVGVRVNMGERMLLVISLVWYG